MIIYKGMTGNDYSINLTYEELETLTKIVSIIDWRKSNDAVSSFCNDLSKVMPIDYYAPKERFTINKEWDLVPSEKKTPKPNWYELGPGDIIAFTEDDKTYYAKISEHSGGAENYSGIELGYKCAHWGGYDPIRITNHTQFNNMTILFEGNRNK